MKKKYIIAALLFGLSLSSTVMAQVPGYVPTNGLVGWWPFNGNANDESGNGNHGTVNGATLTTDRFGNANKAYNFDGMDDNILANIAPSIAIQGSQNITFSYWVNLDNIGINFPQATVVLTQTNFLSALSSWYDNGNLKIVGNNSLPGISNNNVWCVNPNQESIWYHYVLSANLISNTIQLYENGILQGTSSSNQLSLNDLNKLALGYYPLYGDAWFLKGILDDIGIWNRELTQQEITAIYNSCQGTTFTSQPSNSTVTIGSLAQFSVNAQAGSTFQWQSNPLDLGWQNVNNNSTYSGATTNTLTLANTSISNHNQLFRAIVNADGCIDTSDVAQIIIGDTCLTTVTDTLIINTTLSLPAPNNENTILIYPNPASDHITIDNGNYIAMAGYSIKIVNNAGQQVFQNAINQQQFYVDLSSWTGNGLYFVHLIDPQNNTVTVRKIVLQ